MSTNTTLEELKLAQKELLIHHEELEKCSRELRSAKTNLNSGEKEKEERIRQLNGDLEEMMFILCHKVRKSVANILGISVLLQTDESLGIAEWKEMLDIIIKSAQLLNVATEELSKFIHSNRVDIHGEHEN